MPQKTCILMFSGGRDSTLAAVRLARAWERLVLVTVTSGGLSGIARVTRRLLELRPLLPENSSWMHVQFAKESHEDKDAKTCLTCHQGYIVAGAITADRFDANHIALGYSGYQSGWAEQTPYAITKLNEVLASNGLILVLPVTDLLHKEDAIRELRSNDLSVEALEQKCVRQIIDPGLTGEGLYKEVDEWSTELAKALSNKDAVKLETTTIHQLNALSLP